MREPVTVEDRHHEQAEGTAEVVRFNTAQRLTRAVPVAVIGTIVGLGTIVIPGLHLVSTWAIPLLSIGIAAYLYQRRGTVDRVQGSCPSCSAALDADGGAWEDPMWVRCKSCEAPLQVVLKTPMG